MNQEELNTEAEAIRELACKVLNWRRVDVDKFSLGALAAFARNETHPDSKRLCDAIGNWQREWGLR